MDPAAIVVCGPTASGKSGLAMAIAAELPVEIISADSAQVYRGMDIGTAKPSADEREQVHHHLIDIRDPDEPYSAADFRSDVLDLVPQITARGRVPLIVGGTMLYLKALKYGLASLPEADPDLRAQIVVEARAQGWAALHDELSRVDPVAASRIRPTDTQRLQRAIEVYRLTGEPLTGLQEKSGEPCPFPLLEMAVMPADRSLLHAAISTRFHHMLEAGFLDEVRELHASSRYHDGLPAIRSVGYRQAWAHLEGEYDHETMVEKALAATRQLAKRQFTWLRSWQDLHIMDAPDLSKALKIIGTATIFSKSPE